MNFFLLFFFSPSLSKPQILVSLTFLRLKKKRNLRVSLFHRPCWIYFQFTRAPMKNRRLIVNIWVINTGDNFNRIQNANQNFVSKIPTSTLTPTQRSWSPESQSRILISQTREAVAGEKTESKFVCECMKPHFINSSGPHRSVLGSNCGASCPRENIFMGNAVVSQEWVMCSKLAKTDAITDFFLLTGLEPKLACTRAHSYRQDIQPFGVWNS